MKIKFNWRLMLLPFINLAAILCLLPFLPEQIPMHFNFQWEIDGYGPKLAFLLMPLLLIGLGLLFQLLPHIDPLGKNYARFQKRYDHSFIALSLFMIGTELIMIMAAASIDFIKPDLLFQVLFGLLFMFLGNIFPKIKHNYFMGIKTPWTISNEENWTMTHRFGGKLWFLGGFLAILFIVLPKELRTIALLVDLIGMTLAPMIYSYIYFRKTRGYENA